MECLPPVIYTAGKNGQQYTLHVWVHRAYVLKQISKQELASGIYCIYYMYTYFFLNEVTIAKVFFYHF